MAENKVRPIAYDFAVKAKLACKGIAKQEHEYNMTDQLSRSSSSIIANLTESEYAASRADFLNKMVISLKEANESRMWLNMLHDTEYLQDEEFNELLQMAESIIRLLTASVNTIKKSMNKGN